MAVVEGRDPDSEVPPWMCWVAYMPPTASSEPAAWRDPEADTAPSELAPGEAKTEEPAPKAVIEVKKPKFTSVEISAEVKLVPDTVEDARLAVITEMYLAVECSVPWNSSTRHTQLTLDVVTQTRMRLHKCMPLSH